jgi:Tetratricopeptide repeat/Glycosyltransferase family 9 (heptosyltransferase)
LWLALLFRPEHAPTLSCLGDVLRRQGKTEQALPLLEKGVELAPESWEAHSDLAVALCELDRLEEAGAAIEQAVQLHGLDARLAVNLAAVRRGEGRVEEALRMVDAAILAQPEMMEAHVNRAHLLLLTGRFDEGWAEYEWRPKKRIPADRRLEDSTARGKTVLLHQEQGAGDLIQFVRYATVLKNAGAEVTISCDERFAPLMRRARGVRDVVSWSGPLPQLDLEANVMSLPWILKSESTEEVPYLDVDAERVTAWRRRLSGEGRIRVGLVWGGNPANPIERRRAVGLARMTPILRNPDVVFYSLQQEPQRAELSALPDGLAVVDLASECKEVLETAAAIMNLDLVISTDTMVAHLAGALGRPVWVLLPFAPDWRWMLDHEDSPWYPTMRLFRQERRGDWVGVMERVAHALCRI